MRPIFITATGTGIGKTFTTLSLIEKLAKKGLNVGVFKPIETGVVDEPSDAMAILTECQKYNANFKRMKPADITAYTFKLPAAPFCADMKNTIQIEKIIDKAQELESLCDVLLIEGAGGLMVPIKNEYNMADLAGDLRTNTLLVTPSYLGCINETMTSLLCAKRYNLDLEWCVNLYENEMDFSKVTQPYYDSVYPDWWSLQRGLDSYISRLL